MGKKPAIPTISCCMIVKNEEAFLAQCLESVRDHVDEIIVVDTGSSDGTVEIARRYTDRVYFHPWEDSFAKARNQSLSYARYDWIFYIDADEEILPGNGPLLREAVANAGDADSLLVNIISVYNSKKTARHNFERLFRNRDDIRFVSTVHNRLIGSQKKLFTKIELMHYGYNHEEKKRDEKFRRTAGLLKKQIEEDFGNPRPHHYLGAAYLSQSMLDECIKESLLAIELATAKDEFNTDYLWSHYNAAFCLIGKGEIERAEEVALRALDIFPGHLDSHYILTLTAAKKLDWAKVSRYGQRFLELLNFYNSDTDKQGTVVNCTLGEAPAIHILLGHASHSLGDRDSMRGHYEKAHSLSDEGCSVWVNSANYHMEITRDLECARGLLDRAKLECPDDRLVWLTCARLENSSGQPEEEKECLIRVFQAGTKELLVLKRLAFLCMESGEYAGALGALDAAGRLDPADYAVLVNKGRAHYRMGSLPEAVEAYSDALRSDKAAADCQPWAEMGEICLKLDRLEEAELLFDRALAIDPGLLPVLLKVCRIRLLQGDIEGFVGRCDSVMKRMGMRRDRVLNSMEDIAGIILEIDSRLQDRPDLAAEAFGLLRILPGVDYKQMLMEMKSAAAARENEFTLMRLESLAYSANNP